ncbi:hypothetical protein MGYG_00170 [Nannizzia gypsea CBS 118893]|uniref:Uncharacterized protein n=1 Tax=Arthroderma gypseum (strain ATCC MYA-4604 / CBS 118893) TaxID=535722 RepID=E5R398_ARTGP|nr:hypothetical protein MGYG_00170 [Nannizzia gypsea CBS 118893]EFQ97127.1 hypothetical protein MGYG_00170 [Nannizzia gypsea CBS 118893]
MGDHWGMMCILRGDTPSAVRFIGCSTTKPAPRVFEYQQRQRQRRRRQSEKEKDGGQRHERADKERRRGRRGEDKRRARRGQDSSPGSTAGRPGQLTKGPFQRDNHYSRPRWWTNLTIGRDDRIRESRQGPLRSQAKTDTQTWSRWEPARAWMAATSRKPAKREGC